MSVVFENFFSIGNKRTYFSFMEARIIYFFLSNLKDKSVHFNHVIAAILVPLCWYNCVKTILTIVQNLQLTNCTCWESTVNKN